MSDADTISVALTGEPLSVNRIAQRIHKALHDNRVPREVGRRVSMSGEHPAVAYSDVWAEMEALWRSRHVDASALTD